MTRLFAFAATAAAAATFVSSPAAAQQEASDRVNTVIIYGEDECP